MKKRKNIARLTVIHLILILLCLIALLPIYYTFTVSINASNSILSTEVRLFPEKVTFANYVSLLTEKPFFLWLRNTLLLSVCSMVLTLAVAVPAAYAFSRFHFFGRRAMLRMLVILNAFPAILSMFAIYRIMKSLALINTYIGLIVIYIGTMAIFCLWNLKGYFDSIPREIEDATRMDGATDWQLIWQIVMPLARPSIIVTAVLVLIYVWNEYIFTTIFLSGSDKYTLAVGLYSLQATDYTRNWPFFPLRPFWFRFPYWLSFS